MQSWMIVFTGEELTEEQQSAHRSELDELFQANERDLQEMGL